MYCLSCNEKSIKVKRFYTIMQLGIYFKLFEVIFPVFLVLLELVIGLEKKSKFNSDIITNFAGKIGVPALLFYSLAASNTLDFKTFIQFGCLLFFCWLLFSNRNYCFKINKKRPSDRTWSTNTSKYR